MAKYFISYWWQSSRGDWSPANTIEEAHPIDWMQRVNAEYEARGERYQVSWYRELSPEEMSFIKGDLGDVE